MILSFLLKSGVEIISACSLPALPESQNGGTTWSLPGETAAITQFDLVRPLRMGTVSGPDGAGNSLLMLLNTAYPVETLTLPAAEVLYIGQPYPAAEEAYTSSTTLVPMAEADTHLPDHAPSDSIDELLIDTAQHDEVNDPELQASHPSTHPAPRN